jgi:PBSX family phage portal protein
MAGKDVSIMQDDENEKIMEKYPTIEKIFTTSTETVTAPSQDDFSKSVTTSLSGTKKGFKRKITNDLKKYNRSSDGDVESKQIEDLVEISGYDAFGVATPPHNLDALVEVYEMSTPHYAAVNAKVANIVGLGFKFTETMTTKRALEKVEGNEVKLKKIRAGLDSHRDDLMQIVEDFNEEDTFIEILERVWRDYEVMGNGYIEIGRGLDGTVRYVGHICAKTIRIRRKRDGFVQIASNESQFFRNFGDDAPNPIGDDDNPNEIIHLKRYSPSSAYYGVPDIVAAQQAVAGDEYSARYNLDYFENKAVPRHLITLKGANLGTSAQAELLTFFETGLKGQNHRSLFIPLPADTSMYEKVEFKIEPIEAGNQDSSFNAYGKANLAKILMAHRVPVSKVSTAEGASLAIARDADKTFKEQVCQPQQRILEKKLNRIVKEMTDAFELKLNEMTLTDADTQSKIDERNVKNGIWLPSEVRSRDGMPAIKGAEERVDPNAKAKIDQAAAEENTERQRDADRSANSSDSSGEARGEKGEGRVQS